MGDLFLDQVTPLLNDDDRGFSVVVKVDRGFSREKYWSDDIRCTKEFVSVDFVVYDQQVLHFVRDFLFSLFLLCFP